jgi:phosphatidylserine decarboxylase
MPSICAASAGTPPWRAPAAWLLIEVEELHGDLFPLAEHEEVEELRERLGIAGRAASHNQG